MNRNNADVHILLVDDDVGYCSLVREYLSGQGFVVAVCHEGDTAIQEIRTSQPDLVILDLMLPGADGLSVCRAVRPEYAGLILMLTALDEPTEQVTGLEIGADDYVTKPVAPRVLLARIRALLRRSGTVHQPDDRTLVRIGALAIDRGNRTVHKHDARIKLTTSEFDFLWALAQGAGEVVDRDTLHQTLFRLPPTPDDRRVDLLVSRVRKKLGDDPSDPRILLTVRGRGYQLGTGS